MLSEDQLDIETYLSPLSNKPNKYSGPQKKFGWTAIIMTVLQRLEWYPLAVFSYSFSAAGKSDTPAFQVLLGVSPRLFPVRYQQQENCVE